MKTIRPTFLLTLFVLAASSCSEDLTPSSDITSSSFTETIVFNTELQRSSRSDESVSGKGFILYDKANSDSLFVSSSISSIISVMGRGAEISTESLSSFAVSCFVDKNDANAETPTYMYFTQEEYSKVGAAWTNSGAQHYWLSKDFDYNFYAYWPLSCEAMTFTDSKCSVFSYTVPQNAAEQKDLLAYYATTKKTDSSDPNAFYQQVVNLPFKHLMSEISILQGEDMAAGTIYSVEISGFKSNGSYDISANQWTLSGEADNSYTLDLTTNEVGTPTSPGVSLSGVDKNFFILPQTVSAATLSVVYAGVDGEKKTFTASLPETEFVQGKKYTYTINIRQNIEFEVIGENYIDAHYDRFSIKITPKDFGASQSWTVASTLPDVTMLTADDYATNDDYKLLREGYWTDKFTDNTSARGSASLTFTGNAPQTIWVFVPENVSASEREIPLTVSVDSRVIHTDKSVTQYCPNWNDAATYGSEHIDTSDGIVWGFSWSGQDVYTSTNWSPLNIHIIDRLVYSSLYNMINGKSYITTEVGGSWFKYYKSITINYDQVKLENTALSEIDGWQNTSDIYSFNGFGDLGAIVTTLQNNGYAINSGNANAVNPSNSAALAVLKYCNKWNVKKETTEGEVLYTIQFIEINWYLPAINQCTSQTFIDADGIYWTSTAVSNSNTMSNTYTAPNGSVGTDVRQSLHKVKAFRNAITE